MPVEPIGPVVVGVDGSPASLLAVDLATEEAVGRVVPLVVVHASGSGPAAGEERLLAVAVRRALSEHPGLSVDARLVAGEPVEALARQARDACLLVVGHHSHRGSIATGVAHRAAVPVLVHRPLDRSASAPWATGPRPVLVGVAGAADPVVGFAFAEAELRGAPVLAVHVCAPESDAGAAEEAAWTLSEAVAGWSDKYPDVPVARLLRRSLDVPVALTALSRAAQLVVVGASHRHGPAGSVAQALIHSGGCPVAIVPGTRPRARC